MTYGRVHFAQNGYDLDGAAVSDLAELVRGTSFLTRLTREGPLIRPSGTYSPRGEGGIAPSRFEAGKFHPGNFNHEISCLKHLAI
jgi:hypothetical protein